MKFFLNLLLLALAFSFGVQSAMAQEWPINSVATSSAIWPNTNLKDGNPITVWSSDGHGDAIHAEWLAYWFDGFHPVNFIKLYPRFVNGKALGFPTDFNVYWSDGSTWNLAKFYTNIATPQNADYVIFSLPATVTANGIQVVANKLGADDFSNYYFQIAEVGAGYGNGSTVDTGLKCQTIESYNGVQYVSVPLNPYDAVPVTIDNTIQGSDVTVKVGISGDFGGVGVLFSLNNVNILEPRAATGGGWQTSSVIWEGLPPYRYLMFNQGVGNSKDGQWGYHNDYSGLTALNFNPIWSDNIHSANDHAANNPTSPCPSKSEPQYDGYMFDHGKLNIGMATGATSGHGDLVLLTNEYTYQHQVSQAWPSWYAEQAFYLNREIARSHNFRVYLTGADGFKSQIDPFNDLDKQPSDRPSNDGLWGKDFPTIRYAVLVWTINGKDIGVAIDGRHQPGQPEKTSFRGSLMRQDNTFDCSTGGDRCGVFEWHTYMQDLKPALFDVGTTTKVSTDYRVGTLEQLADWGYTIENAPVCSSVTMTPTSLSSNGGVVLASANCTGTDLTYAWTVNGAANGGTTASISTTIGANTTNVARNYSVCVAAHNTGGQSQPVCALLTQTAAVQVSLPSAPIIGAAVASNSAARVSFTPSALGAGTFINYTASCGGITATGTSSPITVSGLTNGTSYTCKVKTISSVGSSAWSALSNAVKPTPPSAMPSSPTIGTAIAGNASVTVAFTPRALGTGTLINYTANCGGITATGTSSPITVSGLTNGTSYTCKVKTISSVGSSAWSALSNSVKPTPPSAAPSSPLIGTAVVGKGSASVSFTPGDMGSGTFVNYTAACGGTFASGTSSPILVTGLAQGTTYFCHVKTTTSQGTSSWSEWSNPVTPLLPAAPVCSSVSLSNESISAEGGLVSAQANCVGSDLSYVWTVNGAMFSGNLSTNSSSVGLNKTASPINYVVCVSASNAGGQSQAVCKTLTQAAAVVPVCSSVTLSPTSVPASGGLVSAQANCSGNGLTYVWRVNGEVYPGNLPMNSSTVGASATTSPTTYSVCVTASSNLGLGQSQPVCTSLIQAGATAVPPSAPVIGNAVVVGDGAARVSFTPSALGSGAFINYTAACSGTFASGTNSPIVVTGLLKGSAYFCHVKVTTSAGTSGWSEWSNPVFP